MAFKYYAPQILKQYLSIEKNWNSIKRTYSCKGNDAQIFEIRNKIHVTEQSELTMTNTYSELSVLWPGDWLLSRSSSEVSFHNWLKRKGYDFVADLNQEYDQSRVKVLGKFIFLLLKMHAPMKRVDEVSCSNKLQ